MSDVELCWFRCLDVLVWESHMVQNSISAGRFWCQPTRVACIVIAWFLHCNCAWFLHCNCNFCSSLRTILPLVWLCERVLLWIWSVDGWVEPCGVMWLMRFYWCDYGWLFQYLSFLTCRYIIYSLGFPLRKTHSLYSIVFRSSGLRPHLVASLPVFRWQIEVDSHSSSVDPDFFFNSCLNFFISLETS